MVGLVIVSHSATLAEGVAELARGMGGEDVRVELAGGLDLPDRPLGTDAALVARAVEQADTGDGVLVLMDLGSAVLSAEFAVDLLSPELRERTLLCEAPLVEGAVAAAVTARLGRPLEEVAAEARAGLEPKLAQLGALVPVTAAAAEAPVAAAVTARLRVENPLGLHARPAARFVETAGRFDAEVEVVNETTGSGPARGTSLTALAALGVRQGHELVVSARGRQAADAVAALQALAGRSFDERAEAPEAAPAVRPELASDRGLGGLPGAPGIALGPARHFRAPEPVVPTHRADDPEAEWQALRSALDRVEDQLRTTRSSVAARADEYAAAIFDAHLLFLEDESLLGPARQAIFEGRRNAAEAWSRAADAAAAAYRALDDEYLRARAEDLLGVARQVLVELVPAQAARTIEGDGIAVAADLTPAETASLDRALVRGIATAYGGPTSHSAILARSLGIPAVVGVGDALLAVPEGAQLLVDGDAGVVEVDPAPERAEAFRERQREREAAAEAARLEASAPAITRDGRRIEVVANIGRPEDVAPALAAGAEGVGLLRTEFLFLGRDSMPSEEEQAEAYRAVAEALAGRPLVLRTLDVGADKPLPYLPQPSEANPFLGMRGIRLGLAEPAVLRTQLRAALRVAAEHPVKIMFPMVATVDELRQARSILAEAAADLPPVDVEIGIMVEVPSAALGAQAFAGEVDFFSLGTNDLTQYTLAAERGNERVAALADPLHPAVLRLIAAVCDAAEARGAWVGVCGELAADPDAAPVLVGLGVTELSAAATAIPGVKQAVRRVESTSARALAQQALELESAEAVRALFAEAGSPAVLGATRP